VRDIRTGTANCHVVVVVDKMMEFPLELSFSFESFCLISWTRTLVCVLS